MTTSSPVKTVVIGSGYWGSNYVRVLAELPGTELVAVCDRDDRRLADAARHYPHITTFQTLEALLQSDAEFDAAVVSTNASSHFDLALALLRHGKHVLVEKPMTTNSQDGIVLIEAARQHGVKLMVGHIFLFNPGVEKIKTYISDGSLGIPYYLYSRRTNLGPIRDDVNALWDLATHDVAVFNYLLDTTPEWVSAVGSNVLHNIRQDVGFVVLGYPAGVLGHIHVSWADPNKVRELVVVGSNERVAFNDLDSIEKVRVFEKGVASVAHEPSEFGAFEFTIRDGDIISPHLNISEPLKNQIKHFVDCIVNERQPKTDGLNGLQVVRVMQAIDKSIERHGAPVNIQEMSSEVEEQWAAKSRLLT